MARSEGGEGRWRLGWAMQISAGVWRSTAAAAPTCSFVMLNSSSADTPISAAFSSASCRMNLQNKCGGGSIERAESGEQMQV